MNLEELKIPFFMVLTGFVGRIGIGLLLALFDSP